MKNIIDSFSGTVVINGNKHKLTLAQGITGIGRQSL